MQFVIEHSGIAIQKSALQKKPWKEKAENSFLRFNKRANKFQLQHMQKQILSFLYVPYTAIPDWAPDDCITIDRFWEKQKRENTQVRSFRTETLKST